MAQARPSQDDIARERLVAYCKRVGVPVPSEEAQRKVDQMLMGDHGLVFQGKKGSMGLGYRAI